MALNDAPPARQSSDLSVHLPRLVPRSRTKPSPPAVTHPPATPDLPPPPDVTNWTFVQPSRRILSPHDHELFKSSSTYTLLLAFTFALSDSVRDTPVSGLDPASVTPTVTSILSVLDAAEALLQGCPPEDAGGSRFGNKAFRSYIDAIVSKQETWHVELLGLADSDAAAEVGTYLSHSFGNRERIDYGSGHELNFVLWLLCLNRLGRLPAPTFPALALKVFPRYLALMRAVQTTYYLEPAGSHGVWGLDDYQFLPFLLGASQLLHHKFIRPRSIHQNLVLEEYGKDYLYLNQVSFVNSVKNVEGLRWHSPMLDDISAAKSWEKVEGGMRKMFVAEVLGKLPVMQHFLFGSLVPAVEGMSVEDDGAGGDEAAEDGHAGHSHQGSSWGDCCGIPVPSSIGAAQEMKKRMGSEGLRRVPFD